MTKEILFASQNYHKVEEIRKLLPLEFSLLSLKDLKWTLEIPEPFDTYEANAKAKAYFVFDRTGLNCFADDSGLEIDALDGRPGIFSARYAGPERSHSENIRKVLTELEGVANRSARFRAIIAYINNAKEVLIFEGKVEGTISTVTMGDGGFGYDPIFIPDGFDQTFGQLPDHLKNKISHRALAIQKFIGYLRK